jgi:hypothetical protein
MSIYKSTRTSDGGDAGNVIEVEEDTFTPERGVPQHSLLFQNQQWKDLMAQNYSLIISLKELNNQYRKK